jgi:hypothetical protein
LLIGAGLMPKSFFQALFLIRSESPDKTDRYPVFADRTMYELPPTGEKIFSLTPDFMKNIFLMKKYFQSLGRKSARQSRCFLIL